MADYSWPATLPQDPVLGWVEQPIDVTTQTNMDVGPPKVRRRHTAGVVFFKGLSFVMTKAQVVIFEDFRENTLSGGAVAFDMPHPRTGTTTDFVFMSRPEYSPVGPDAIRVTFDLNGLP